LLETYLSGQSVNPGDALKSSSTDVPAWDGTNSTGFNGLPHGFRALNGNTYSKDISGGYWTTTPDSSTEARMFYLNTGDQYMNGAPYVFIYGFAVRCLEDAPEPN
jgi:uncharacterized protein (TIGR02145 family)